MAKKKVKKTKKVKEIIPSALPVNESAIKRVEPDEFYKARFEECIIGEGKYGPYARLVFVLLSGNLEDSEESAKDVQISALCNAQITPKNAAWPLIKGILNKDPIINEPVDVTPYYGKTYKVLVTDGKKKDDFVSQSITKIKKYLRKK